LVWGTRTALDLGLASWGSASSCRGSALRPVFSPPDLEEGDAMTGGGGPIDRGGGDDRGERSVRGLVLSLLGEELLRVGLSLFFRSKSAIGSLLNLVREAGRGESRRGDRSLRGDRPPWPSRCGVDSYHRRPAEFLLYSFLSTADWRNDLFASQASVIVLDNVFRREAIALVEVPWGRGGGGGSWSSCPGGLILSLWLASMNRSRVKEFQRVSPSITILKNSTNSTVGRVGAMKAAKWKS